MKNIALITTGGIGKRMGTVQPKQFISVKGKPILAYTIEKFQSNEDIDKIILVLPEEYLDNGKKLFGHYSKITDFVAGGKERINSVLAGLNLCSNDDFVAIHDGVRPFINSALISAGFFKVRRNPKKGFVIAVKEKNTVKRVINNNVVETLERSQIWEVQTPQFFKVGIIKKLTKKVVTDFLTDISATEMGITDDASILEMFNKTVEVIEGNYDNIKITTPEDIKFMNFLLESEENYDKNF